MEWTDEGIVLGVRRHGESSAIVELLTRGHGRHLGLVRGGAGSRMRPLLQPGNSVTAVWRARLDEHLGTYQIEGTRLRAATAAGLLARGLRRDASGLAGAAAARARSARRHSTRCSSARWMISTMSATPRRIWSNSNSRCWPNSASGSIWKTAPRPGQTTELIYVSPKSGGAVSRAAGAPFHDRLLRLPAFLRQGRGAVPNGWSDQDLQGRFSAHGDVPAAPRAGAARAGPFRRPRRFYQCGDQASDQGGGSVTPRGGLNWAADSRLVRHACSG